MKLTQEQQNCLLKARSEYLSEVGRLLEARQGLQATLKASLLFQPTSPQLEQPLP